MKDLFFLFVLLSLLSPLTASASGGLIKCSEKSSVYYLDGQDERWVFPNEKIYFSWYQDFDDVQEISCATLASYKLGGNVTYQPGTRLVKIPSVVDVYAVESGGILRAIPDEEGAIAIWGEDWAARVDDLSEAFYPSYQKEESLGEGELPEGTILYDEDDDEYWRVGTDGTKYSLDEAVGLGDVDALMPFALSLQEIESVFGELDEDEQNDYDDYYALLRPGLEPYAEDSEDADEETDEEVDNPLEDHNTYLSFSDDPTDFDAGEMIAESASVPDVLVCTVDSEACDQGDILVYFVNAEEMNGAGTEKIAYIKSTNGGESWSGRRNITISGQVNEGAAVDPSVVQLADTGEIRLYFFGSEVTEDDPGLAEGDHVIYSAISENGRNFELEDGERLAGENITDPEVIQFKDVWYLYYSLGSSSGVATSEDGLDFDDLGEIDASVGGVPGAVALSTQVRLYGCASTGIPSAYSSNGSTFTLDTTSAVQLGGGITCDPSVDVFEDEYVMVYKIDEGE